MESPQKCAFFIFKEARRDGMSIAKLDMEILLYIWNFHVRVGQVLLNGNWTIIRTDFPRIPFCFPIHELKRQGHLDPHPSNI